jgi:hypothetical protein
VRFSIGRFRRRSFSTRSVSGSKQSEGAKKLIDDALVDEDKAGVS